MNGKDKQPKDNKANKTRRGILTPGRAAVAGAVFLASSAAMAALPGPDSTPAKVGPDTVLERDTTTTTEAPTTTTTVTPEGVGTAAAQERGVNGDQPYDPAQAPETPTTVETNVAGGAQSITRQIPGTTLVNPPN